MIQEKTFDFTGKISGSTAENKAVAYLNETEFTQEQYDNIFSASLKLPALSSVRFEFPIDIEKDYIQFINNFFTSKSENGIITLVVGDYGIYNRNTEFTQKRLQVNTSEMVEDIVVITMTNTSDMEIYGVKVVVPYDDKATNRFSGNVNIVEGDTTTIESFNQKTYEETLTLLQVYDGEKVESVIFAKIPTAGEINE